MRASGVFGRPFARIRLCKGKVLMEYFKLNDGNRIPAIAFRVHD